MWTVTGEAGKAVNATSRTPAAMGMLSPRLAFRNLAADELSWTVELAGLAPASELIPKAGQIISLYRSGTRFFTGHALPPSQSGTTVTVRVMGVWWWLERVFLESLQTDATGATGQRPTYAFPKQSLTTSLNSLLTAAIALGVPMTIGTLATTFELMESRWSNMSFAQAISELVRITPDMVFSWDYSGTGYPAAQTTRRLAGLAAGSATTIDLDAEAVEDFTVNPAIETQVSQVRIPYLDRAANGAKKFHEQSAGAAALGKVQIITASGDELDTFLPKDLIEGHEVTSQAFSAVDWLAMDSAFQSAAAKHGPINTGGSHSLTDQTSYWNGSAMGLHTSKNPVGNLKTDGGNVPAGWYFLSSGAPLPEWLRDVWGAFEVTILRVHLIREPGWVSGVPKGESALFNWAWNEPGSEAWATSYNSFQNASAYRYCMRPFKVTGWAVPYELTAYTQYRPSDYDFISPPAGLADGLLAAQNWLAHSGEITMMEGECGSYRYLPSAINLTNALPSFATMRAMLSAEELDLENGTTTLLLGPPARFSYADLVNKIRGNPNSNIVYL